MKNPKQVWSPEADIDEMVHWREKARTEGWGVYYYRHTLSKLWGKLRMAWGVPKHQSIDDFVLDEIEGRGHKFVRAHRNIEARY